MARAGAAHGEIQMTEGSLWKNILLFSIPLVFSQLLQVMFNMADVAVVGKFASDTALGSVGSTSTLVTLFTGFLIGMGNGVNVRVAQHLGAQHREETSRAVHTAFLLCLLAGVGIMALCLALAANMLEMLHTKDDLLPGAVLYFRIYALGMPALGIFNFGASVLRAAGDTKRPLIHLTLSGITNVILNLIFVIACKMDVAGVALATTLSQYLSAALTVFCLVKEQSDIRLEFSKLHIYPKRLAEILRMGIPAGIQSTLFSFSNVILQTSINSFGDLYVAGNGAASQIESIMYTSMNAFYMTTTAFTSQNFGAQKKRRVKKTLLSGLFITVVVMVPLGLIVTFFADPLLGLFTTNAVALEAGRQRMRITTVSTFIGGSMDIFTGYLRGLGASIVPMFTTLIGVCVLRIVWILVLFPMLGGSWEILYLCYPITWGVTLLAHFCYSRIIKRTLLDRLPDREDSAPATAADATEAASTLDTIAVPEFDDDSDESDEPVIV